jgi:hypothetical protein
MKSAMSRQTSSCAPVFGVGRGPRLLGRDHEVGPADLEIDAVPFEQTVGEHDQAIARAEDERVEIAVDMSQERRRTAS